MATKVPQTFEMKNEKIAYIFSWGEPDPEVGYPNPEDVDLIATAAIETGFKILVDSPDEESLMQKPNPRPYISNPTPIEFKLFLEATSKEIKRMESKLSCLLLYIVVPQVGPGFKTELGKTLALFDVWTYFREIKFPKIIIIQGNILKTAASPNFLLNEDPQPDDKSIILPQSANTLMMYLPKSHAAGVSAAKIFQEEFKKLNDINANLTSVIHRIDSEPTTPLFSSTLHKKLFLGNGSHDGGKLPMYSISQNKNVLVFTFLFEEFGDDKHSLKNHMMPDKKNLNSMYTHYGFTSVFCISNGSMTADDFTIMVNKIVKDKEVMKSCECIMIVISTHGDENGRLLASDQNIFTRKEILCLLLECEELKGKPKILVVDACRGSYDEQTFWKDESKAYQNVDNWNFIEMPDVLQLLSSTERNKSLADRGSLFITALCTKLKSYGKEHDVLTVMNSVMEEVARESEGLQQPTFTSTLKNNLQFPK